MNTPEPNDSYFLLVTTFDQYAATAKVMLHINDDDAYRNALEFLEWLFDLVGDTQNDPRQMLIDLVSQAIESYEDTQPDIRAFVREAEKIKPDVAVLSVLMDQYRLTSGDFPEIGGKSRVENLLKGKGRSLTRKQIAALVQRFKIDPSAFF